MLEFEVEALFLEFLVLGAVEAVEAGGAAGDVLFDFVGFGEDAEFGDFFAKVAFVERLLEDEFVEVLELGEGEFFGEEFEADGLVAEFSAEAFAGEFEDFLVIEGEGREVVEGEPGGVAGIGGGGGRVLDEVDEGVVGDSDDVFPWVAVGGADGGELFEEDVFEAGFFFEFTSGAGVDVFADLDEAAGESPFVFEGGEGALDEEDFEVVLVETEDDAVGGEGGSGVVVGEGHGRYLSVFLTLCKVKVLLEHFGGYGGTYPIFNMPNLDPFIFNGFRALKTPSGTTFSSFS